MALGLSSTPSLTEINSELGTTGQSLVTCIANAGKTGVWTKQSDFAGYSKIVPVDSVTVSPTSMNFGHRHYYMTSANLFI